jgi:hypothetical protein
MNKDQKRSYSTTSRRPAAEADSRLLAQFEPPPTPFQEAGVTFEGTRAEGITYPDAGLGHKFPMPDMSEWKITNHVRRRYDPVVDQVTKSIMRDGKMSVAQKVRR